MNEEKVLEVAVALLHAFGVVTIERDKKDWEIKITKGYYSSEEMKSLQEIAEKHALDYIVEQDTISVWNA